jgi:cytochrome c oxidase subunit II
MKVHLYERIWMWAAAAIIIVFVATIVLMAAVQAVQPASHIETVDPTTIGQHPEFAAPAVTRRSDGTIVVSVVAAMYSFTPDPIEVPANRPVTFRLTSSDVLHGLQVAGTNVNAMAVPGYVSQFTYTFQKPGEYLITCHEFCGLFHHAMVGKLIVREAP